MSINFSSNSTEIARFAGALYNLVLDNATMNEVLATANSSGLTAVLNGVYSADFGTATDAAVATTIANNLGLTGTLATGAENYITGVLAGTAPAAKGAAVMNILNLFASLTTDATWGAAATAWESKVANSVEYGQNSAYTTNGSMSTISNTAPGQTFTLTSGIDHFTGGPGGNNTFNATDAASGNPITFTALDALNGGGGTGNVLNITYGSNALDTTAAAGATVTGIQTASLVESKAAAGLTADTTGWTGLTTLNTTATTGVQAVTAAATTNVTSTSTSGTIGVDGGLGVTATSAGGAITIGATTGPAGAISVTDTKQAASNVSVNGGTGISVTTTGNTGGLITIGNTTKPSGAVTVNDTIGAGGSAGGAIAVTGGTTVAVTQAISNATGTSVTEGAVTVTGGASTTTVTVNQAYATGAAAVTAVAGVVGVTKVTATPGTQGVSKVTAVNNVNAVTGVAGATAGAVTIQDANYNTVKANTITSVTLNNFGATTIKDNALTNLSLTGTGGAVTITNATAGGVSPTSNAALNLTVNGLTSGTITDTNGEITTLNVTTAAADSTLGAISAGGLTTLNVSGSNTLTLTTPGTSTTTLTTIAVSGAAGFNDSNTGIGTSGLDKLGATLTSFTTTSSGTITAALDDAHQSFKGSTGQDIITINALADASSKITITGGSANNNELIVDGAGAYALTSATTKVVTGFETLGVGAGVTGSIDMSIFGSGYNTLDILGNSTIAFTKVNTGSGVLLDGSSASVSVQYIDANGAADSTTVGFGSSTTHGLTAASLTLMDANTVGIGTVNVVSNGADFPNASATPYLNTITALVDNGLSKLNVSGTESLVVVGLNEAANQATAFTLNNTDTGSSGVAITTFTDAKLGSLTFAGSGVSTIGTLVDAASTTLSISNTGSHTATIGAWTAAALTNLTLGSGVAVTATGDTATTGITISGAADNAHVTFAATSGAAANATDTITLGNANNNITDASIAGTVNLTVGTGSNLIVLGGATTDTTGVYNVTLGTHSSTSGIDSVSVGTAGTAFASAPNLVLTGAVKGDLVVLAGDAAANSLVGTGLTGGAGTITATTITSAATTVALAVGQLETAVGSVAHGIAVGQYAGNTYIVESNAALAASATTTTVIELVGLHTISAVASSTTLHVAS